MVRNNILLTVIIGLLIVTSGCKDTLNEHLYSSVPVSAYYKNTDQAQLALNGVYHSFWEAPYKGNRWYTPMDVTGGILSSYPTTNEYDNFSWTPTSNLLQADWERLYQGINLANTLLDKLNESNIEAGVKSNISGQAKFLRALSYFDLVKLFGGVPLYINGTKDLSNTDLPRSSVDSVYQQVVTDLQDAVQELSPYKESDHAAGKATSAAAQALLAQVYAQKKEWSKAASAAKKVIDMGVFGLDDDYEQVLDPAYNNNKEKIFSIQHGKGGPTYTLGNHNVYQFGPPPTSNSDGKRVEFFHTSKGLFWQANQTFFDHTPKTYRKWQTMRNKMPYYYEVGSRDIVRDTVALDAPFIIKYNHLDTSTGELRTDVNVPIIRYSNVLLLYAESLNEANSGPNQPAYDAINQVRARARGLGTGNEQPESVYPPLSGLNQETFRDSVLAEEARELVGEGHRRSQLLRHDRFISNAQNRGINAQEYHKLYPIPTEELDRNTNLKQNPGYPTSN